MHLPQELWDEVVPDQTTVVGDVDVFILYFEHGHAYADWLKKISKVICWMEEEVGGVSPDIINALLLPPE